MRDNKGPQCKREISMVSPDFSRFQSLPRMLCETRETSTKGRNKLKQRKNFILGSLHKLNKHC